MVVIFCNVMWNISMLYQDLSLQVDLVFHFMEINTPMKEFIMIQYMDNIKKHILKGKDLTLF